MSAVQFSVIIPTYNQAQYLSCAIESVLRQEHPVREVIVVDDGSDDDAYGVARVYSETVQYMRQDNAGVGAARNAGAAAATGDWLAFLDADDWFYPDRIRCHAEWIAADPGLDFLSADMEHIRPDGGVAARALESCQAGRMILDRADSQGRAVFQTDDIELFLTDYYGGTCALSLPRRTFAAVGGYPEDFRIGEDIALLARLCAVSRRIGILCRPTSAHRLHDESATRKNPLAAQRDYVATLAALQRLARGFPAPVRRGLRRRTRIGRQRLGYAYMRGGRRMAAVRAVLPTLWEDPGAGARDLLSMLRG